MRLENERATTLLEVTIATAIIAIIVGAVLSASITAIRHFGPDVAQSALDAALAREMRLAVDVLNYGGSSIAPTSISTTIPCASAAPLPATIAIPTSTFPDGGLQIRLTGSLTNPARKASLVTTLANRAPMPGSVILAPQPIAQPFGDP